MATTSSANESTEAAPAPGTVRELDTDAFSRTVPNHPFAVVDFWAPWCGPCRSFAPVFEKVAAAHPDVLFAKVNTEDEQGLAAHFGIRSIPTLMIFRDNVIVYSQPGALNASSLEQLVSAARDLDMNEVRRQVEGQRGESAGVPASDAAEGPRGGAAEY